MARNISCIPRDQGLVFKKKVQCINAMALKLAHIMVEWKDCRFIISFLAIK